MTWIKPSSYVNDWIVDLRDTTATCHAFHALGPAAAPELPDPVSPSLAATLGMVGR